MVEEDPIVQDPVSDRKQEEAPLVGAAWDELTAPERAAAIAIARREGRRAVQETLGVREIQPAPVARLRRSPWAQHIGLLDELSEKRFRRHIIAHTLPCEDTYVEAVVDRLCPARAWWWWGSDLEERRADPRVCACVDAYERARCVILGMPPPPTGMADLQLRLWEAKEQERALARAWLEALRTSYSTEAYGEGERAAAMDRYERSRWDTDLAEMLLNAAAYGDPEALPRDPA
jgi:tellurite resistance protein